MPSASPGILIVGAGFGGIAAAIELRRHGFDDVTILDARPRLGGTWLHNSYPGAACDVPSHLYSFSFAQRRDWSRLCSPQEEILDYLRGVARDHGVDRRVVAFDTTRHVLRLGRRRRARWTVDHARTAGPARPTRSILATGQLHQPAVPAHRRASSAFAGHSFHSARVGPRLRPARQARRGRSAPARAPSSSSPRSPSRSRAARRLPAHGQLVPAARATAPTRRSVRAAIQRVPGLQAFRRAVHLRVRRDR